MSAVKLPQGREKFVVLDVTTLEGIKVVAVAHMHEAGLIGQIYQAINPGKRCVAPQLTGQAFAKLTKAQLQYLYWNMKQVTPPDDYAELSLACREAINFWPMDETDLRTLQKNAERYLSGYAQQQATVAVASNDATAAPAAAVAPRVAIDPDAPVTAPSERPKSTTTTGLVWDLADAAFNKLYPKLKGKKLPADFDWKPVRDALMAKCDKEGINKSTSATQYSKWRKAKAEGK